MVRAMKAAWSVPMFPITVEVDMTAALARRQAGATVTDILLLHCAATLAKHPGLNAHWQDEGVVEYDDVNLGLAVADRGAFAQASTRLQRSLAVFADLGAVRELSSALGAQIAKLTAMETVGGAVLDPAQALQTYVTIFRNVGVGALALFGAELLSEMAGPERAREKVVHTISFTTGQASLLPAPGSTGPA